MKCKTCPAEAIYTTTGECRKCYNRRRYREKKIEHIKWEQKKRGIINPAQP